MGIERSMECILLTKMADCPGGMKPLSQTLLAGLAGSITRGRDGSKCL